MSQEVRASELLDRLQAKAEAMAVAGAHDAAGAVLAAVAIGRQLDRLLTERLKADAAEGAAAEE